MLQEILAHLEKNFKESDDKAQELFINLISNKEMSLEDRIHYSMQHMKYSSKSGVYTEIICLIKYYMANENCWEEKKQDNCLKEKDCIFGRGNLCDKCTYDKKNQEQSNCEKNHNSKEHTEEDDEEFTKIKKQLEVLKQYISDEIKNTIDNMNFWYENQPDGEQCSLNDYKKYIKTILVVVYNTKREADVWNKIMDQINIISKMLRTEK